MFQDKKTDITILAMAVFLVLTLVVLLMPGAKAQTHTQTSKCSPTKSTSTYLEERFGETPVFLGVSSKGYLLTLFLNEESGTWTIGKVSPSRKDVMCPLDAGGDGYIIQSKPAGDDVEHFKK